MKKIFTLCIAVMAFVSVSAQHEIGVVAGGLNGLSYKFWFSSNFAVQMDLAVGLTAAYGGAYFKGHRLGDNGQMDMYDFTLNPNLAYHFDLPNSLKLYVGAGVNAGFMSDIKNTDPKGIFGKAGANALFGMTYAFGGAPLSLSFDFRPGYGAGFTDDKSPHMHFFDWKLAVALRYVL